MNMHIYIYFFFSSFNDSQSYDIGKMEKNSIGPEMLVRIVLNVVEVGLRNTVYVIVIKL